MMLTRERALSRWLSLATTLALTTVACGGEPAERSSAELAAAEKMGGLAVICSQSALESLNPFVSPDLGAADLRLLLFTPLVLYNEAGGFHPYLATDWRFEDGGRRLILDIRQDVVWHDGTPLTAEDVVWTLRAAADPEYAYWNGPDFADLEEVVARDSDTVELRFSEPLLAELEPFVGLPILPRHLLADLEPDEFSRAEYHRSPVGSGPFRLVRRRADGVIDFERADEFPADLGEGYLDRIVLRPITEATTLVAELETGGVDMCVTGSAIAEELQRSGRLAIEPIEPAGIQAIFLNNGHAPLDDARVRRALSAALRRSEIGAVQSPLTSPAGTLLPASSPWIDPALRQPDGDSALAASLLESAGWTLGSDGVRRNAEGRELGFTLVAPPPLETPLTVLQAQLRRVGVVADLRFMEFAAFIGAIRNPETRPDAMALGFSPEKIVHPYNEVYGHLHSSGQSNLSSYSEPAVDLLLERLQTPLSPEERRAIYLEIQTRVVEDVPALYTLYVPRLLAVGPKLQGVELDLNGPYSSVTEWWIPANQRRR